MEKILTVSIAAYNVEKFIQNALESIVSAVDILEKIEIFVIDDGGNDKTLEIAKKYEKKYPESVFAVHKLNGGYGSTVNYGILNARGKYFKLLDGDDWFNTEELKKLVNYLLQSDVDIVVTPYYKNYSENENKLLLPYSVKENDIMQIENLMPQKSIIGHHCICYKTELLRKSNIVLPEHTLYTDAIYSIIPFSVAKNIVFLPFTVYMYRMGRDEQSVNIKSKLKHIEELKGIILFIVGRYNEIKHFDKNKYILHYIAQNACIVINTLLHKTVCSDTLNEIKEFEAQVKNTCEEVYKEMIYANKTGKFVNLLRKTNYFLYWLTIFLKNN